MNQRPSVQSKGFGRSNTARLTAHCVARHIQCSKIDCILDDYVSFVLAEILVCVDNMNIDSGALRPGGNELVVFSRAGGNLIHASKSQCSAKKFCDVHKKKRCDEWERSKVNPETDKECLLQPAFVGRICHGSTIHYTHIHTTLCDAKFVRCPISLCLWLMRTVRAWHGHLM